MKCYKAIAILSLIFIFLQVCHAARPFNTDDANIVEKDSCQLETWIEAHKSGDSEAWALPSCNLFLNTEITIGGMGGLNANAFQFQLKTLFIETSKKGYGIGLAVGNIYYPTHIDGVNNEVYFYIPATLELFDARLIFHANVGYTLRNLDSIWIAGLGSEVAIWQDRMYAVGEVYYSRFDPVIYQVGLRTWILKDILQIDSTYGNDFSGQNHFVSIGFRILSEKMF